jgi:hypothetical protein
MSLHEREYMRPDRRGVANRTGAEPPVPVRLRLMFWIWCWIRRFRRMGKTEGKNNDE